jgi:heterodisulfide reductase subunit A
MFDVLAHPIREKIIRVLGELGPLTYSELREKVGVEETGKFNYHLNKISPFIEKKGKLYSLNEEGYKLYNFLRLKEELGVKYIGVVEPARVSRIGIAFCQCHGEASKFLNLEDLSLELSKSENIAAVETFGNICSPENIQMVKKWVKKNLLDGLIVVGCSPEVHKGLSDFLSTIDIPYEIVNVLEGCIRVNRSSPKEAFEKARCMINGAVRAINFKPTSSKKAVHIPKSVAVIGGGISGLIVAKYMALMGFETYLVEREYTLGGRVMDWSSIYGVSDCASCIIAEMLSEVLELKNLRIFTNSEVAQISGAIGNFQLVVKSNPKYVNPERCSLCGRCVEVCPVEKRDERFLGLTVRKAIFLPPLTAYPKAAVIDVQNIQHCLLCRKCEEACPAKAINFDLKPTEDILRVGAIVIAIGCENYHGELLKRFKHRSVMDVITNYELEGLLSPDGPTKGVVLRPSDKSHPKKIAVIQCVNEGVCSKYCCTLARKYYEVLKREDPNVDIRIFFEEDRIPANPPLGDVRGLPIYIVKSLRVENGPKVLGDGFEWDCDLVVLNVGEDPRKRITELKSLLNFSTTNDGFLNSDTLSFGVFACGSITGPKTYRELVYDAQSTALKVASLFIKEEVAVEEKGILLDEEKCGVCGLCNSVCPFNAVRFSEGRIVIDQFNCKSCGLCVSTCPTGALRLSSTSREELIAFIDEYSKAFFKPKILVLACANCGYPAFVDAGIKGIEYPANVFTLKIPCAGLVDSELMVYALNRGFDGILVVGCRKDSCRYGLGAELAGKKIENFQLLEKYFKGRVRISHLSAVEGRLFAKTVEDFIHNLKGGL